MARIPTYESQVIEVVPDKNIATESVATSVVQGITKGVEDAVEVAGAVGGVIKAKEEQDYANNLAPRMNAIDDSSLKLNQKNNEIKASMASAPNAETANKQLDEYFSEIMNNAPKDLDRKSLEDWQKTLFAERTRLKKNNLSWGAKASADAGKKAAEQANINAYKRLETSFSEAGASGIPVSSGTLSIDGDGMPTDGYIPPLDSAGQSINRGLVRSFFQGQSLAPLETDPDNPSVEGILGDNLDELEGIEKTGWWIFGSEGKTKQQVGEEKINAYFDKVKGNIEQNPILNDTDKKALTNYVDAQYKARMREFTAYIETGNLELQAELGRVPDLDFVPEYFENLKRQQENQPVMELNVKENQTVEDIRKSDTLSNMFFGNDYQSVATFFEYAPLGRVSDFTDDLKNAIARMEIPVGRWDKEELFKKYAPNNTINEIQAVEALVRNTGIELTGKSIDAMKEQNGFNETDWAYDIISDISQMPSSTNEEKQRKQAMVNHAIFQAEKEINGGNGMKDKSLMAVFDTILVGGYTDQNGNKMYSPIVNDPDLIRDVFTIVESMKGDETPTQKKQSDSIINQGLAQATSQYLKDGNRDNFVLAVKRLTQNVLSARYQGVVDVNDLQSKLENKQPAIFVYNGQPYEYLGFSGKDIFVKSGAKQMKLGD